MEERPEQVKNADRLAREVLTLARNTLLVNLRFLDMALSRLDWVSDDGTMSTDGRYLYYGSRCILLRYREEREQSVRDLLHAVFHCVFRHMYIHTLVDHARWDLACDIAVEYTIAGLGLKSAAASRERRQRAVFSALEKELKFLTAEKLYRYYMEQELTEEELAELRQPFLADDHAVWYLPLRKKSGAGGAAGQGESTDEEELPDAAEEHEHASGGERAEGGFQDMEGPSGESESSGAPGPGKSTTSGAPLAEGGELPAELSRREAEQFWKEVSERMQRDIEFFPGPSGTAPGGLIQNLTAVNREKYDYTAFLRKFAVRGEVMRIDDSEFDPIFYTYGLRLYENIPLVEPLEYREDRRIREFVIAIDTSGSVSGALVQKFVQKTYNVLLSTESFFSKINLHILQCDAAVQEDKKITSREEFLAYLKTMQLHGGGGTDFRPVFAYVGELQKAGELRDLQGLIYLTDGRGIFPERKPPYSAAFVFIDDEYNNPDVPPWAVKLVLPRDEL